MRGLWRRDVIEQYLSLIVVGIATGSIYAIAAMGLTLTYKTTGVFNFAHGAIGAAAAYVFYVLHVNHGVPWPLAALIAVVVFGIVTGGLLELLGRRLAKVSTADTIVATVGVLLGVKGTADLIFGGQERLVQQYLPTGTFKVAGVFVGYDQLIDAIIALVAAVGLSAYLHRTRSGKAMSAVVDNPELIEMTGYSSVRVRREAWVIGSMFAALAGVLIVPLLSLDATKLTLLVVQAFGAAAVGRFSSLPMTYVGGLVMGVAQQLVSRWVGSSVTLQALPTSVPFFLLFGMLLITRRGGLPDFDKQVQRRIPAPRHPAVTPSLAVVGIGVVAFAPAFAGTNLILFATALAYVGLFLSLSLLVRVAGQVSLGQLGLMAIGSGVFGHLVSDHTPWLLALLLAGLITVPFGAVIAIPAARLSGLYLALATLGYGLLIEQVLYRTGFLFGNGVGVAAPRPHLFGLSFTGDTAYYYLLAVIDVLMVALVVGVVRSRLGRLLRALGDSPRALTTHGANVNVTRVIVFCVAALLCGVAGALYVPLFGNVNGDTFPSFLSLVLLAVLALCGRNVIGSASLAALAYFVAPGYINNDTLNRALPLLFGGFALFVAVGADLALWDWFIGLGRASRWRVERSPVAARSGRRTRVSGRVPA